MQLQSLSLPISFPAIMSNLSKTLKSVLAEPVRMSQTLRELGALISLDKWAKIGRIVKQKGIVGSLSHIWVNDNLKEGTLIGVDEFGNKYFENNSYSMSKNRWVEYNKRVWLNYDASQVSATWFRWLHHQTDTPPSSPDYEDQSKPWVLPHKENMSITTEAYVPYSTTRTKIEAWQPKSSR